MLKTKNLRIDYYHLINLVTEKDEFGNESVKDNLLDLTGLLERLESSDVVKRNSKTKNGDTVRFQIVKNKEHQKIKNKDGSPYKYWELEILKERSSSVPGVATKEGEYNPIDVNDGDLLSEDVSVLYDPKTYVMAVLRKREGLSPVGIADVLTKMLPGSDVELRPLISRQALDQFTSNMIYRSFTVSMINDFSSSNEESLIGILNDSNDLKAPTINFTLSIGRNGKKDQSLNFSAFMDRVRHLLSCSNVTALKLTAKSSKSERAKAYDLLNQREHDLFKMEYSKEYPIDHKRVFNNIEEFYFRNLERFQTTVN